MQGHRWSLARNHGQNVIYARQLVCPDYSRALSVLAPDDECQQAKPNQSKRGRLRYGRKRHRGEEWLAVRFAVADAIERD